MRELELYVPRSVALGRALRPEVLERRDPTAATQQLAWTSPGLPQHFEWDADQAFRLGYAANVIAYRCIQIIANAISAVPIVAGPRRGQLAVDQERSPLAHLLGPPPGGPAKNLSARKLIRWTLGQEIVTGRRAWEIETHNGRPDGRPVALWPLVSARLKAVPTKAGADWFRVFEYGVEGRERRLAAEQVFFGWEPSGLDFRQAESPLQVARFDLSLVSLCDRYGIGFLRNNATPATVVTTTVFPDDATRRAFRQQWAAEYQGPDNAGRTYFNEADDDGQGPVSDSIHVQTLGLSHKDARLVEIRRDAMVEVAMALGVPWSKLDASGRTFDNADVEDRTFWEERLLPLMEDLIDDVNMQIAPRLGSDVAWFDLAQVRALRRRMFPSAEAAASLLDRQVVLPNEVRADLDLPPVEWGDEPLEITQDIPHARPVAADVDDVSEDEPVDERAPALPPAPEAVEHRGPDADEVEARRARIWRSADAVVRTLEAQWERQVRRLFSRQEKATISRLEGNRGRRVVEQRATPDELFDPAFWMAETNEVVAALYEAVVAAGGARVSDLFGIAFDLDAPWAAELIRARANMLAGQVTDTTYAAITEAMAEGTSQGESIPKLADRIRAVFADASERRATVIARTEVISAYNGSATLAAASLPPDVVAGREWIATRDGRTRAAHAAADGQVVPIGAPFDVGGDVLLYPGDPNGRAANTVQCRCTVAFLTPAEMAERTGVDARVPIDRAWRFLRLVNPSTDLLELRRALAEEAA